MLTIAYITNRINPLIEYFWDGLNCIQNGAHSVIVVDFYKDLRDTAVFPWKGVSEHALHISPKPSAWAGPHRLTTQDFFDVSNARNTAICHARDGHIAFVDDLSVMAPGWVNAAEEAAKNGYIACGAYYKVNKLQVKEGVVKKFEDYPAGKDPRWQHGHDGKAVPCPPEWFFGCGLSAPIEAFLKINGYPEDLTAGMGYEDSVTGKMIAKQGYQFRYDRRMLTYESVEDHHNQPNMLRVDPDREPKIINGHRNDKSHEMLARAARQTVFENYFGEGFPDLRTLREHVLKGGAFPVRTKPTHEWFTGKPLAEFP